MREMSVLEEVFRNPLFWVTMACTTGLGFLLGTAVLWALR